MNLVLFCQFRHFEAGLCRELPRLRPFSFLDHPVASHKTAAFGISNFTPWTSKANLESGPSKLAGAGHRTVQATVTPSCNLRATKPHRTSCLLTSMALQYERRECEVKLEGSKQMSGGHSNTAAASLRGFERRASVNVASLECVGNFRACLRPFCIMSDDAVSACTILVPCLAVGKIRVNSEHVAKTGRHRQDHWGCAEQLGRAANSAR